MKLSLRVKSACIIIVFTVALLICTVLVSYNTYTRSFNEHYTSLASSITHSTASVISKEQVKAVSDEVSKVFDEICTEMGYVPDLETLSETEREEYYSRFEYITEMPEYSSLMSVLERLRRDNNVVSLYLGYTDVERLKDLYLVDASDEDERCMPGDYDNVEEDHIEQIRQGNYELDAFITNYPDYGWLCSASAPIFDENGNVIASALVDISMNKIITDRQNFLIIVAAVISVIAFVMVLLVIVLMNKSMLQPLKKLSLAAESFISGKKSEDGSSESEISKLNIKSGDEIEDLCNSIKQMENDINTYVNELVSVTAEKERIGAELDVAAHIQANMLPSIFPAFPERKEFDIYATMTPAKEVGGDFYDFFMIDDDHLGVVMADVSGKGVPAALFMVIAKTLIKNRAQLQSGSTKSYSPAKILSFVNDQLCEGNEAELFVTVWFCIIQISTGKCVASNAGHEYPAIRRSGGKYELVKTKNSPAVATMEGMKFREYEFEMSPGDSFYVYTDGVAEATDSENNMFGTERMIDALNADPDASLTELLVKVKAEIDSFVGETPQFDDITMLGLKYYGKETTKDD